jgi:hypothetical protein
VEPVVVLLLLKLLSEQGVLWILPCLICAKRLPCERITLMDGLCPVQLMHWLKWVNIIHHIPNMLF